MSIRGETITVTYTAWDTAANAPKTGDVANHTIQRIVDAAAAAAITASPVERENGVYAITLTGAENSGGAMTVEGASSTGGVVILPAKWLNGLPLVDAADVADNDVVGSWPMVEDPTGGHLADVFFDRSGYGETLELVDQDGVVVRDAGTGMLIWGTGGNKINYARADDHDAISIDGTFSISDVTISANGALYEAWPHIDGYPLTVDKLVCIYRTGATIHNYDSSGKVVLQISTDAGATWGGEVQVGTDVAGSDDRNPAILCCNPTGTTERLIAVWNTYLSEGGDSSAKWAYSDDNGATWQGETDLSSDTTTTRTRGRPIELSTGAVLIPVYKTGGDTVEIYAIDTSGVKTLRGTLSATSRSQEITIIELKSGGTFQGDMKAWVRDNSASGGYYVSTSTDYGVTWTAITANTKDAYITSNSPTPMDVIRLSDDTLIASNTKTKVSGNGALGDDITLWVSTDEAKTWIERKTLFYDRTITGYPSLVELSPTSIGVIWCINGSGSNSDVHFNTFTWPDCDLEETGILSFECVFKRSSLANYDGIVAKGKYPGGATIGWGARIDNAGDIDAWGGDAAVNNFPALVNDLDSHHFVLTITQEHLRVYLDGELVGASAHTGWTDQGDQLVVAARKDTGGFLTDYWEGHYGWVKFYKRALSAEEVAVLYRQMTTADIWGRSDRRLTQHAVRNDPTLAGVAGSLTVLPLQASADGSGRLSPNYLTAYQYAQIEATLTILDAAGDPVNLTGLTLAFVAWLKDTPATTVITMRTDGGSPELTIGGASNNQVTIDGGTAHTATAAQYDWVLYDLTNSRALAAGTLEVEEGAVMPAI